MQQNLFMEYTQVARKRESVQNISQYAVLLLLKK